MNEEKLIKGLTYLRPRLGWAAFGWIGVEVLLSLDGKGLGNHPVLLYLGAAAYFGHYVLSAFLDGYNKK